MQQTIGHISFLVRDYDQARAFFTEKLGFELVEDSASIDRLGGYKRWVLVRPRGASGPSLLLAQAFDSGGGKPGRKPDRGTSFPVSPYR